MDDMMKMIFGQEADDEETFHVMYRLSDGDTWYSGGDLNGYSTIEEAREAAEAETEKAKRRENEAQVVEVGFYKRTISVEKVYGE